MRPADRVSRRLIWLIIAIGAIACLAALLNGLLASGAGISLPFTRTPLDGGWLFVFGLLWLIVGVILMLWMRPIASEPGQADAGEPLRKLEKQIAEFQSAQVSRLTDLQTQIKRLEEQLDSQNQNRQTSASALDNLGDRLGALEKAIERTNSRVEKITAASAGALEVDHELGNLATTLQDVHERLDNLGDVHSRLDDLTSQVDALYVTLQDIHHRLDIIEGHSNPR